MADKQQVSSEQSKAQGSGQGSVRLGSRQCTARAGGGTPKMLFPQTSPYNTTQRESERAQLRDFKGTTSLFINSGGGEVLWGQWLILSICTT